MKTSTVLLKMLALAVCIIICTGAKQGQAYAQIQKTKSPVILMPCDLVVSRVIIGPTHSMGPSSSTVLVTIKVKNIGALTTNPTNTALIWFSPEYVKDGNPVIKSFFYVPTQPISPGREESVDFKVTIGDVEPSHDLWLVAIANMGWNTPEKNKANNQPEKSRLNNVFGFFLSDLTPKEVVNPAVK